MKTLKSIMIVSMSALFILILISSVGYTQEEQGEESGIQYTQSQKCVEVRSGVQLTLKFDKAEAAFIGTMKNISKETAARARVEVHLSNGIELGPTKPVDILPGKEVSVKLDAKNQTFTTWSAHAEVGAEGSEHGEGTGEHVHREGGELNEHVGVHTHGEKQVHEHKEIGVHEHKEMAEHLEHSEHSGEGHGEEGEESGIHYSLSERLVEVRRGIKLTLEYDKASSAFIGSIRNISEQTASVVVEVHLSNGIELGPTTPVELGSGKEAAVKLSAKGQEFTWWSAQPEVKSIK
ncbi:hypothetical protein ACFLT9_00420 [Acidobacteriota bacterium]